MSSFCANILSFSAKNYKPKLQSHKNCTKNFLKKKSTSKMLLKLTPTLEDVIYEKKVTIILFSFQEVAEIPAADSHPSSP